MKSERPMYYVLPDGESAATYDGPPIALDLSDPANATRIAQAQEGRQEDIRRGNVTRTHVAVSRIWEDGHITEWNNPIDADAITVSTVFMGFDHAFYDE